MDMTKISRVHCSATPPPISLRFSSGCVDVSMNHVHSTALEGLLVAGKDKLCIVCRWHLATTKRRYVTLKAPNVLYSGNLSGYGLAINASYEIGLIWWSDLAVLSHIPTMTYSAPHLQMSFPSRPRLRNGQSFPEAGLPSRNHMMAASMKLL